MMFACTCRIQETRTYILQFGPFASCVQKRWKKPVVSAKMRLESRTVDLKFDKLTRNLRRLKIVLRLQELIEERRVPYVSVQLLSKWRRKVSLNTEVGVFLRKYPHIFEIFIHPVKRNYYCKLTRKTFQLLEEESNIIKEMEWMSVCRLKKLLMISTNGSLHIHAIRLITRELGFPDDFKDSILLKYPNDFRIVNNEIVELVSRDETLAVAEIEKWREKEYTEKWLSEFEVKYAFPIQFPTGFRVEKGFRESLRNWQRLHYLKPYEKAPSVKLRSCGGVVRFEKRVVAILHEFLNLTVEKMIPAERISHFQKDFSIEVNVRELLLKHQGIFYVSTKGNTQTVFLREAYSNGNLIEPNPIYVVRRKILDLLLLGSRCTHSLMLEKSEWTPRTPPAEVRVEQRDGAWVIPILDVLDIESDKDINSEDEHVSDIQGEGGCDNISYDPSEEDIPYADINNLVTGFESNQI